MTDIAAMPPPPAYPTFEEVEHSVYGFECETWEEIPYPNGPDWFTEAERSRRNDYANQYQKYGGTPTGWHRYLELGFFGYEDCSEFEEVWNNFDDNPLAVHQAIWYQFMYHLDRELEISEKLQEWSTNYTSHVYMAFYDPESLQVDTSSPLKEWKILKDMDTSMEDMEDNKNTEEWIAVPERGRRRNKSPQAEPKEINQDSVNGGGSLKGTDDKSQVTKKVNHQCDTPARQAIKELHNQLKQSKRYQKIMKPASKLPQVSTVQEEDKDVSRKEDDISNRHTTEHWSHAIPRLPSFKNVPVNDGTHRLTIRWKPPGGIQQYEHDKHSLNTAIQTTLCSIIDDEDGMMYRWESKDLKASARISTLTETELRDFVSPQITLYLRHCRLFLASEWVLQTIQFNGKNPQARNRH